MTNYILHGGNTTLNYKNNNNFFAEINSSLDKSNPKILFILWSRAREDWDRALEKYTTGIIAHSKDKIDFEIANDPQDFVNKVQDADTVYVVGGDADKIEPYFSQLPNFKEHIEGKTYIGGSMGAFMVSKHYVLSFDNQDYLTVHDGLGIFHFNLLCHWDVEKRKSLKIDMLKKHSPDLPILTIPEGEFVKFVL